MCAMPPAATTSLACSANTARALSDFGNRYTPSRSAAAPLALRARQMRIRAVLFSPDTLLTSISHSWDSGIGRTLLRRHRKEAARIRTPVQTVRADYPHTAYQ